MTYDYECPDCGDKHVITCRVADRDAQHCHCGMLLRRLIPPIALRIVVPSRFGTHSEADKPGTPKSQWEWDRWDNDCVRKMTRAESKDLEEKARAAEQGNDIYA